METAKLALIVALVAVVIATLGIFLPRAKDQFGASGTRMPNGISTDSTSPTAGQIRGTTLLTTGAVTLGGTLTVTTSNTATSTVSLGCIQTTATSTATPVYLTFTPHAGTTTTQGGTSNFLVSARFGPCPI